MRLRYGKPRRLFFWVKYKVANTYGILGPYKNEAEANTKAIDELKGAVSFEVIPLDTKDKSAASGKLKAVILNETKDITQAMHRIRRKAPSETKQNIPTEVRFL